jgi:hypothetical protein
MFVCWAAVIAECAAAQTIKVLPLPQEMAEARRAGIPLRFSEFQRPVPPADQNAAPMRQGKAGRAGWLR